VLTDAAVESSSLEVVFNETTAPQHGGHSHHLSLAVVDASDHTSSVIRIKLVSCTAAGQLAFQECIANVLRFILRVSDVTASYL